jgi:hypothetical protein
MPSHQAQGVAWGSCVWSLMAFPLIDEVLAPMSVAPSFAHAHLLLVFVQLLLIDNVFPAAKCL